MDTMAITYWRARRTRGPRDGFTLIEMMIVIAIIAIIAAIAVPALLRSRIQSNETSTIQNLRTIISAQMAYHAAHSRYAGSMEDLVEGPAPFVHHNLIESPLNGYIFEFNNDEEEAGTEGANFTVHAAPANVGVSGIRYFYTDGSGVIRYSFGGPADGNSLPLQDFSGSE